MKRNRYLEFLYEIGFDDDKHWSLAEYLHSKPYRWRLEMDGNRKWDGLDMRVIFDKERHSPAFYSHLEDHECTMLEFFVGFAYRLVRDMFGDEDIDIPTILRTMFSNLEIFIEDDDWSGVECEDQVDDALDIWIKGDYNNYGDGNIFRFKKKHRSLWTVHMWVQASWWYGEEYLN